MSRKWGTTTRREVNDPFNGVKMSKDHQAYPFSTPGVQWNHHPLIGPIFGYRSEPETAPSAPAVSADPNYPEGLHNSVVVVIPTLHLIGSRPCQRGSKPPKCNQIINYFCSSRRGELCRTISILLRSAFFLRNTARPYFPGGHWIQILSESTLGQQRTDKSSRFGSGNCFVVCLCPSSVTCLKSSTSNKEREKKRSPTGMCFSLVIGRRPFRFLWHARKVLWGKKMCVDRFAQKKCSNW